ncbi:hypothetical protein EJB05_51100, partial [Eragrostis curvula]
ELNCSVSVCSAAQASSPTEELIRTSSWTWKIPSVTDKAPRTEAPNCLVLYISIAVLNGSLLL